MKNKKSEDIIVLYNTPVTESESDLDTEVSAKLVSDGLNNAGYETKMLGISPDDITDLKNIRTDIVFSILEWDGPEWEYATDALINLDKSGVPYTGSNARGYEMSANKLLMKKKMSDRGIPTPTWTMWNGEKTNWPKMMKFPVLPKLAFSHCGEGISQDSLAYNHKEAGSKAKTLAAKYGQPVYIEEFVPGREMHVTILERNGRPVVLPIAEVCFDQDGDYNHMLTYNTKWDEGSWEYTKARMQIPRLGIKLETKIKEIAKACYLHLGGRDYPRVDMRVDGDRVMVLEINNNPGIDYELDSGIGVSARAAGLTWEGLLKHIVVNAGMRWGDKRYATV